MQIPTREAAPLPEHRIWALRALRPLLAAAAVSILATAGAPHAVWAQNDDAGVKPDLEAVERERHALEERGDALKREAEKLAGEARATQRQLVETAAEARRRETAIAELETRLTDIEAEEKERAKGLEARRARLKELLAALERIARHPPEAMMAYTRTPQDTLRGAMLLRAAIPKLEAQARELRESLEALADLRDEAAARAKALTRQREALEDKRRELAALVEKKKQLARATEQELQDAERRQAQLARKAKDLRQLLENIEAARERDAERAHRHAAREAREQRRQQQARVVLRPPPPPSPPGRPDLPSSIAKARGKLVRPVLGNVAVSFGEASALGVDAKGAYFAAPGGSQVLAPFGGDVVFSGPFRGYGLLLIIDHGEGYHSLLAGLGRIDASVGQRLLAGEPVGVMARAAGDLPRLYMELRKSSRPIDPLPWLAAPSTTQAKSKVSG